jgi:hypothetical protein
MGYTHFTVGAIFGIAVCIILSFRERWKLWAPLSIFILGLWAALPYVFSRIIPWIPPEITDSTIFNLFIFYPFFEKSLEGGSQYYAFFTWWFIYSYICLHYILYTKQLIRKKIEKNA